MDDFKKEQEAVGSELSEVIDPALDDDRAAALAPLVKQAARARQNVLFIATVALFWSVELGKVVWRLQATMVPARAASKIVKLIRQAIAAPPSRHVT